MENKPQRKNKPGAGAPRGNKNAARARSTTGRRMINLPPPVNERLTAHLEAIGMTWPQWSQAVVTAALDEET